eukprot:Skav226070  [mRNA]  locus=scaffold211:819222:834071:- [translate_table: standard]
MLKNNKTWAKEDSEISQKLKSLESKFKKKPNIIYILSDDIGFGELGWQGGGKHRGTPGPGLDDMAYQGMRFWSSYSEPSCTPSRVAIMTGRHPVRTGLTTVLWPGQEDGLSPQEVTIAEAGQDPKPFFIYWATYAQQLQGDTAHFRDPHVDPFNAQASRCAFNGSMMAAHSSYVTQLLSTLKEEKIEENTLVVWMSDNGPMYAFYPNSGYSWLRGGKGQVLEGGVRTPSMAWWPGMISANQDPVDVLHITATRYAKWEGTKGIQGQQQVTASELWANMLDHCNHAGSYQTGYEADLYTTAARLGGALDAIPNDRVTDARRSTKGLEGTTDGVDQSALLLHGEGHGRRKKVFFYSGDQLAAMRHGDIKDPGRAHFTSGGGGGLPKMEAYNVRRDPGEKYGRWFYPYLWTVTPIMRDVKAHKRMIQKFPHRGQEQTGSCHK